MSKWAARFALGLSNSVPGIRIKPENIRFIDDISGSLVLVVSISLTIGMGAVCEGAGPGKPPSEMQMTDGCGFANRAVMLALHDRFAWEAAPTAVQCRIGGAKGLLLQRYDLTPEEEAEPTVWLRPSQIKIKYLPDPLDVCILPEDTDPARLTLDVLRASRMKTPAKLSTETITNFAENKVPFSRFGELFQMDLDKRVDALLAWGTANDKIDPKAEMKVLWDALAREGGVISARLAREGAGTARAEGYVHEDREEEEWDDEDGLTQLDKALHAQSSAWWEDPISGCPSSLEETCMTLIDSGFRPETCPVLTAKLGEVARKVVRTFQANYRFAVPMSCSAFIVPGGCGAHRNESIEC